MTTIRLSHCFVAAAKADLVKGRVRISFEATLDAEVMAAKTRLAMLAIEKMPVSLLVESAQAELFSVHIQPLTIPTEGDNP
jgi:hypothetical protein